MANLHINLSSKYLGNHLPCLISPLLGRPLFGLVKDHNYLPTYTYLTSTATATATAAMNEPPATSHSKPHRPRKLAIDIPAGPPQIVWSITTTITAPHLPITDTTASALRAFQTPTRASEPLNMSSSTGESLLTPRGLYPTRSSAVQFGSGFVATQPTATSRKSSSSSSSFSTALIKNPRKKFRKMRITFDEKMRHSNDLYEREQKLEAQIKRLALENE